MSFPSQAPPEPSHKQHKPNMSAPTSRLCVKNIPKHMKEDRLRQHFGQRGEVTDVKIMKTADGRSRLFGFIGFRTEKEAKAAMNFFNNTFIDTSKISVEMARPVGDTALPRPWSKYSKGSSLHEQKEQKKKEVEEKKEKALDRKRKWKDILDVKEELAKSDPQLLTDFLSSSKSRQSADARKVWANDLLLPTPGTELASKQPVVKQVKKRKLEEGETVKEVVLAVRNRKTGGEGQLMKKTHLKFGDSDGSDSDEMYEDMPAAAAAVDAAPGGEALPTISVGDLMRLENNDDDDDDDGDDDDDDNVQSKDDDDEDDDDEEEDDEDEETEKKEKKVKTEKKEKKEKKNEKEEKEEEKKEEEQVEEQDDTGRLFVRNLPFSASEDDLYKLFKKHGDISEVHIPIDRETKKPRGMAYVTFMLPEVAAQAHAALDGSIFQGRLLHIMPAKMAPVRPAPEKDDGEATSFRKKKEQKLKESSSSSHNWNPFFMKTDAVLDAVAANLGVTKQEILNPEDGNMSTRVAIAETRIISETKAYLKNEGINMEGITAIMAAEGKVERSKTMILVKNIPHQTKLEELRDMFSKFGSVSRVILPPARTLALIEYLEPSEARRGFKNLAYTKFHHVPLYLEWAPLAIIGQKPDKPESLEDADDDDDDDAPIKTTVTDKSKLLEAEEMERLEGTTLYVKNLNFKTTDDGLRTMFEKVAPVRSVTVAKRKDVKKGGQMISLGYGFVEFVKRDGALKAIKQLQGKQLDNHALEITFAKGGRKADTKQQSNKRKAAQGTQMKPTCTILVKNVAFEATKAEIRELFATFGQLKSVRVPKKMDGRARGFAFVDFITKQEAKNAFQSLQDTHLYGRHLVLEFVQNSTASQQNQTTSTEGER